MDWNKVNPALRTATIAAFDELSSSLGGERPYAICLQTDDGGMGASFCANTEAGFVEKCTAEAEVEEMTPDYESYLRWAPAEWRYEMFAYEHFSVVNATLADAVTDLEEGFKVHFDHLLDAMIDALANLRAEREVALDGITLFVTISDSEDAEATEDRSAACLNDPALAEAFARRFD